MSWHLQWGRKCLGEAGLNSRRHGGGLVKMASCSEPCMTRKNRIARLLLPLDVPKAFERAYAS